MKTTFYSMALAASCLIAGCRPATSEKSASASVIDAQAQSPANDTNEIVRITHDDPTWRKLLTPAQYHVLRGKGTEPAFTGAYWDNHADGVYECAACGLGLFSSKTKFESGTGWPSFFDPVAANHVHLQSDNSFFMRRVEVQCARCGSHIGHVFDDGPAPTGQRYCMNSIALKFVPADSKK